jgi:hypothetical protein
LAHHESNEKKNQGGALRLLPPLSPQPHIAARVATPRVKEKSSSIVSGHPIYPVAFIPPLLLPADQ